MNDTFFQLPLIFDQRADCTLEGFAGYANAGLLQSIRELVCAERNGLIYLSGDAGLGKTHLLCAAANTAGQQDRQVAYVDLARRAEFVPAMLQGLERMHLVCLDNMDAITPDRDWERTVMLLFDAIHPNGGMLVAAATRAVELPFALADLKTRMGSGLTYKIMPLDDQEKTEAIRSRAAALKLDLPQEVAEYLIRQESRDQGYLFALVEYFNAASIAQQRRLTIPFVKRLMIRQRSVNGSTNNGTNDSTNNVIGDSQGG